MSRPAEFNPKDFFIRLGQIIEDMAEDGEVLAMLDSLGSARLPVDESQAKIAHILVMLSPSSKHALFAKVMDHLDIDQTHLESLAKFTEDGFGVDLREIPHFHPFKAMDFAAIKKALSAKRVDVVALNFPDIDKALDAIPDASLNSDPEGQIVDVFLILEAKENIDPRSIMERMEKAHAANLLGKLMKKITPDFLPDFIAVATFKKDEEIATPHHLLRPPFENLPDPASRKAPVAGAGKPASAALATPVGVADSSSVIVAPVAQIPGSKPIDASVLSLLQRRPGTPGKR